MVISTSPDSPLPFTIAVQLGDEDVSLIYVANPACQAGAAEIHRSLKKASDVDITIIINRYSKSTIIR